MMRIFFTALMALLTAHVVGAQPGNVIISQFNTDNGLPQNSVKDIAFDPWGFCWLATEMGLVRYDGQHFETYDTSEIKGLESERIEGLSSNAQGKLYARAYGGQIIKIEVTGKFAAPGPVLLPKWSVHVGLQGVIVDEKQIVKKLESFYNRIGASPFPYASNLSDREIYLHNQDSLLYLTPDRKVPLKIREYKGRDSRYTILGGKLMVCLLPGNLAEVWQNGRLMPGLQSISGPLASNTRFLSGDYVALPSENGFYVYAGETLYQVHFRNRRLESQIELENVRVPSLTCIRFLPEQNTYYLGSSTDGLFKIQKSQFGSPPYLMPPLHESLYAQADAGNGDLVVKNLVVSQDKPPRRLPIKSDIASLLYIVNGQLYYAQDFTLWRIDLRSGKVRDVAPLKDGVVHMSAAKGGGHFFAQSYGFARLVNDQVVGFKEFPEKTAILFARQIRPSYFLVCTESGLKWYDYERNRIDKSVLGAVQIRTVYPETDQKIWIATYGKGFYLFQDNKLYRMPLGPAQALKTVHSFIEDGGGFFWLPSNNGLFKVRKSDLSAYAAGRLDRVYFFRFDRSDGLPTNEFNGGCDPSYLWLKDSLLSLPSMKGLVWFYPKRLKPYFPERGIFTDSLMLNNRPFPLAETGITLDPDFKRLSVKIASPYFGNNENLGLEYRMAGLDPEWRLVDETGVIAINSLPDGDYQLMVRRNGLAQPDAPNELLLRITVRPWFYNTWWFYVACICVSVLIAYLLFKRRLTKLEWEAVQLENTISDRTQELKSAVEDLAKSEMALLESNRFKDHVITLVLHDMRSPLRFISLISGNLLKNHTQLAPGDLDSYLGDLHLGTQNLLGFTEQFFMWIGTQQQGFKIRKTSFPVSALFEEIASLYKEIFKVNHNRLTIVDTHFACVTDYQILSVVIRNLIDNANKNTYEGEITLACAAVGDGLLITVSDTGQGLTTEQIALFMSRDRQSANRGTGSLLIHTMLDYIQGKIAVTSQTGQGSTFTIILPDLPQSDTAVPNGSTPSGF